MAVMAREVWTDERLDDLNGRVANIDRRMEAGFAEMRTELNALTHAVTREFVKVREETRTEFVAIRTEIVSIQKEMHREFTAVRTEVAAQFAAQNRMMVQLFGGMFATFVVGTLATIATVITQT